MNCEYVPPLLSHSVSSPVLQVEALKIAFKVIDILLLNKKEEVKGSLNRDQTLYNRSFFKKRCPTLESKMI